MVEVIKYSATGRRKTAIARVTIVPGEGAITINRRAFENYFPSVSDRIAAVSPLVATNNRTKFNVTAKVCGGGISGQADALKLALARALSVCDEDTKSVLKKGLFLRRDSRMKERQKPGQKGARKKFQWVKR